MTEERVKEYFLDKRGEISKSDEVSTKPLYVRNFNEDLGTLMVEVPSESNFSSYLFTITHGYF